MESSRKPKSVQDMDRGELESEMRRRKMTALEAHADFGFIVGTEKESAELMHCSKVDLLAASEYFEGLLRSPSAENPPVWIKHIKPHIFKMVLNFVSVQTLEKDLTLEDAVALGLAADEFLLDILKSFCASEIKRLVTMETVWRTLNLIVRIPDLPDACSQMLSLQAKKCLEHKSFLEASEESLFFLLEMETLAIDSELDLIEAAIKLAKTKPEREEMELMKAVIPHLRLLSLPKMEQLKLLSKYLSDSQKLFLTKKIAFKEEDVAGNVPPLLHLSTVPRCRQKMSKFKLDFIAEDLIKSDWEMMGKFVPQESTSYNRLQMELVAQEHLLLKGIEVLTRAHNDPKLKFASNDGEASSRISTLKEDYVEDLEVFVYIAFGAEQRKQVFKSIIKSMKKYNSWLFIGFEKKVLVPKGATCFIDVESKNPYQHIPFAHIRENIEKAQKCAAFSKIEFKFMKSPTSLSEVSSNNFFCIKSLFLVPVDDQGRLDNFE